MGAAVMRTVESFNDGQWHNALLERRGDEGTLYVDGYLKANGTSQGDSVSIDVTVGKLISSVARENFVFDPILYFLLCLKTLYRDYYFF